MKLPSDTWLDGMTFCTCVLISIKLLDERHYIWATIAALLAIHRLAKEIRR